jgi:hypothetical protein
MTNAVNYNTQPASGGPIFDTDKQCSYCKEKAEKISKCANCLVARYCGKVCQKKDWKTHKIECATLGTQLAENSKKASEQLSVELSNLYLDISKKATSANHEHNKVSLRAEIAMKSSKKNPDSLLKARDNLIKSNKSLASTGREVRKLEKKMADLNKQMEKVCMLKDKGLITTQESLETLKKIDVEFAKFEKVKLGSAYPRKSS